MHSISVAHAFVLGLLVTAPLAAGYAQEPASQELNKRYVGGPAAFAAKMVRDLIPDLETRHHTEAQIAAKKAKAAKAKAGARDVPAPDEFGPWDSDEDEFGSWVDKREPHHTEAQIAAKKAKAAKAKAGARDVEEREPHHTEAQIAAKKAKAAKAKAGARDVPAPDEFGPWDSEEDEFGSWVDKREPHHTEAQIAAKKAKAAKSKAGARDVEEREPHHTEAQIAAKDKAAKAKGHAN